MQQESQLSGISLPLAGWQQRWCKMQYLMAGATVFFWAAQWLSSSCLSSGLATAFSSLGLLLQELLKATASRGCWCREFSPAAGTKAAARVPDAGSKSLCFFLFQDKLLREFGLPHIWHVSMCSRTGVKWWYSGYNYFEKMSEEYLCPLLLPSPQGSLHGSIIFWAAAVSNENRW